MILSAICLCLYYYVIKYKRGGWWSILKFPALFVAILDVIANYTEWWFLFGRPPKGAYTISKRVRWMQENAEHQSHRDFARLIQIALDAGEDDGKH